MDVRAVQIAQYIVDNKATIRQAAQHFGMSKSNVHHDIKTRLSRANRQLNAAVREVLNTNSELKHSRGGQAAKRKFEMLKK